MRVFIAVLVLILNLQSWTKADDISDFEIEGMSIGDSALDHFSKEMINENTFDYYKDKKFTPVQIDNFKVDDKSFFEIYDAVDFDYKTRDDKFIIASLNGIINKFNSWNECLKKKEEIVSKLKITFENTKKGEDNGKHRVDPTGKSVYQVTYFDFDSGDSVDITCYDYSDEVGHQDHLAVRLLSKEFYDFMMSDPYN